MENLLQGFGIVACIGAALLVLAVVLIARAVMGRRNNSGGLFGGMPGTNTPTVSGDRGVMRDRDDEILTQRGSERPTYDADEVRTSGGFGGASIPATGGRADRVDDDAERRTMHSFDQPGGGPLRNLGDDDVSTPSQPRSGSMRQRPGQRPPRRRGGGDINSGGGFGG